jgi:hypothetical protein
LGIAAIDLTGDFCTSEVRENSPGRKTGDAKDEVWRRMSSVPMKNLPFFGSLDNKPAVSAESIRLVGEAIRANLPIESVAAPDLEILIAIQVASHDDDCRDD